LTFEILLDNIIIAEVWDITN